MPGKRLFFLVGILGFSVGNLYAMSFVQDFFMYACNSLGNRQFGSNISDDDVSDDYELRCKHDELQKKCKQIIGVTNDLSEVTFSLTHMWAGDVYRLIPGDAINDFIGFKLRGVVLPSMQSTNEQEQVLARGIRKYVANLIRQDNVIRVENIKKIEGNGAVEVQDGQTPCKEKIKTYLVDLWVGTQKEKGENIAIHLVKNRLAKSQGDGVVVWTEEDFAVINTVLNFRLGSDWVNIVNQKKGISHEDA